jgi:hypothetical protein
MINFADYPYQPPDLSSNNFQVSGALGYPTVYNNSIGVRKDLQFLLDSDGPYVSTLTVIESCFSNTPAHNSSSPSPTQKQCHEF